MEGPTICEQNHSQEDLPLVRRWLEEPGLQAGWLCDRLLPCSCEDYLSSLLLSRHPGELDTCKGCGWGCVEEARCMTQTPPPRVGLRSLPRQV